MPSFSIIAQDPQVRDLVQTNALQRQFRDALFPNLIFRADAEAELWPGNIGDQHIFTGKGLITPNTQPLVPGVDPQPESYSLEQWEATLNQWAQGIDTHTPTSALAAVNLFLTNAQTIGLAGGQTVNRVARNVMVNAGCSGNTVADGAGVASTALRVKSLNGFTRARNPSLSGASKVRFSAVSSSNPLAITIEGVGSRNVIGYTPDTAGDEAGPGILTLSASASWSNRAYVLASDRSLMVRPGGALKIDGLTSANLPTLADVQQVVAQMGDNNVPPHADGFLHCHLDTTSIAKMFRDDDLKRLNQSLPDYYMYKKMALGELLGVVFVKNTEMPRTGTVTSSDALGIELVNPTNVQVRHMLFTGGAFLKEYYNDQSEFVTEAGMLGSMKDAMVSNDGIEVNVDHIKLIFRPGVSRLGDIVSATYRYVGSFVARTDAATGDSQRYKRATLLQHGT